MGLTGRDHKFWPINASQENLINNFHNLYHCIDHTADLKIYGGLNSEKARLLQADIVKCIDKDYCKSDEEIRDYFANMFILVLRNQIRFDQ